MCMKLSTAFFLLNPSGDGEQRNHTQHMHHPPLLSTSRKEQTFLCEIMGTSPSLTFAARAGRTVSLTAAVRRERTHDAGAAAESEG